MNRRTRRRICVVAAAAVMGAGAPVWAPPLLRTLPAFTVQDVRVTGVRYLDRGEVLGRAGIPPEASVWDDPAPWEERVEGHVLVESARIHRSGLQGLEIRVVEVRPLAFVAAPELTPVDRKGRVLPLDPSDHALDLPIAIGEATVEEGRVQSPDVRSALDVLWRLRRHEPSFVSRISEVRSAGPDAVEVRMMEGAPASRLLLPTDDPVRALGRVELALGDASGERVRTADARFRRQVVLRGIEPAPSAGPGGAAAARETP